MVARKWELPTLSKGVLGGRLIAALGGALIEADGIAEGAARLKASLGTEPATDYVLVCWNNDAPSLRSVLASLAAEVPVCVTTAERLPALRRFLSQFPPAVIVADRMQVSAPQAANAVARSTLVSDLANLRKHEKIGTGLLPRGLLYLGVTSGTTGEPRVVGVPFRAFEAFADWGCNQLELDSTSIVVEPGTPAFDMPMTNLLLAIGCGARFHIACRLHERVAFWRLTEQLDATHLRTTPTMLRALSRTTTHPKLRILGLGGELISRPTVEKIEPPQSVVATYGCTEGVGFIMSRQAQFKDLIMQDQRVVTYTAFSPHVTIESREVDEGEELVLSGTHLPAGYLAGTVFTDGAGFSHGAKGELVFRTADLVSVSRFGVAITGRRGRMVKHRGDWINLEAIAASIGDAQSNPCIVRYVNGMLFAVAERVDASEVRAHSASPQDYPYLRSTEVPDVSVEMPTLPIHSSGKADMIALDTRLLSIKMIK